MWRRLFEFGRVEERDLLQNELTRRVVRLGSGCSALIAALFAMLYAFSGMVELCVSNMLAVVALAGIAATPTRDATVPLYLAITAALLVLGYQLVLLAEVTNGVAVWFVVPNVAAMILGMRRLAVYCATGTIAIIAGVVLAARAGWLIPQIVMPHADVVMAVSMLAVLVLCGLFAFITLRARLRLMSELEARNTALGAALEEARSARNAAVEASLSKERFFANLTHEIRTPLNGIAGTAELLQHTILAAEQQPLARALCTSTANLVELVNAMLDHAKLSAGHVSVECAPLDLHRLKQELGDLFRARAAEKGLGFAVTAAEGMRAWVGVDALKLRQIVDNLVSNAIKFSDRGSVCVRLCCTQAGGAEALLKLAIEVADSGPGIAPAQLDTIFDPFVQGDASISRRHGGTGLGLAIARQLATLLGGSLEVDSALGRGSVFRLELPVLAAEAPAMTAELKLAGHASIAGQRVLLVEDNAVNQLVARAMLETLQIRVCVAASGLEALEKAASNDYAVILMDLQMPGMDGIAATREIRQRERRVGRPPVPIVALTGNSSNDYGKACVEAGMDGFLMKPVALDALKTTLLRLCVAH